MTKEDVAHLYGCFCLTYSIANFYVIIFNIGQIQILSIIYIMTMEGWEYS